MIAAFGAAAERFARAAGELDAIVTEPSFIAQAYLEAVARRERGERFYGMVLLDDARVAFSYAVASEIAIQHADPDVRRQLFERLADGSLQVNGTLARELWKQHTGVTLLTQEFYLLCDAMLVRSYAEYVRFAPLLGRALRPVERVLTEPDLPIAEPVLPDHPRVVVWAPFRSAAYLALPLQGLGEFLAEIVCVVADAGPPGLSHRFVTADDPALPELLRGSSCVVCAEPCDPGDAVAFARRGYGVVAALTAGAHEFADVIPWDAARAGDLHTAAAIALGRPAALRSPSGASPRPRGPMLPLPPERLPLVSIVTPTYNRPADLTRLMAAVARQTYPNVEHIVVNDGGTPVADIVAPYRGVRLIENERNVGAFQSATTGTSAARGPYVMFLPDDDWLYPDHIERIMSAMLRSGAKLAHSRGLLRYAERAADEWKTTGFNATLLSQTVTPRIALLATTVSENSVIHDRRVFEEAGWWIDSPLGDTELHMRYATRYVFAFIDDTTFEFREHPGNLAKSLDFPADLERLYREVHPVLDRPVLQADRAATLEQMRARKPGPAFPPTIRLA